MFHTADNSQMCIDSQYVLLSAADYNCLKFDTPQHPTYLNFLQGKSPPSIQDRLKEGT